MDIGGRHLKRMDQTAVFVHANVGLISKVPFIALFYLMRIRVPLLVLVFVEDGAAMMVESTIVPFFRSKPFSLSSFIYL